MALVIHSQFRGMKMGWGQCDMAADLPGPGLKARAVGPH